MRIIIFAEVGKVLTDGKIYGTPVVLGKNKNPDEFTEITIEEYEKIRDEESEENL